MWGLAFSYGEKLCFKGCSWGTYGLDYLLRLRVGMCFSDFPLPLALEAAVIYASK